MSILTRKPSDGEPCDHPGCLSHVSHPCEGCGRIAGRSLATATGSAPSSDLRAAALRLGVAKLNCKTCVHGHEDTDGSDGSYWYCGMTCSKHEKLMPETYLEDNGVDIEAEKSCWHPDFWKAETPEIMNMIDDTEESMDRACKAWRELVEAVMPEK